MNIHELASAGDFEGLAQAIEAGAALELKDENGYTPLMAAAASPKAGVDILQLLLSRGADLQAVSTPMREHYAAQSVLGIAAKDASLEKIKLLITAGANVDFVDAHGYSILLNAFYGSYAHPGNERLERHRIFVDAGAPLDVASQHGESILRTGSSRGEFELVRFLLDCGADPAPLGWTSLFHAVVFGGAEEVAKLIDQGVDLELTDAWERTPFLLSVHAGRLDIAKLLLARGCNRNAKGRCGKTAILLAISRDDAVMLEWLISVGSDIEETDEYGGFPLAEAASEDAVDCVKILLAAGAVASRTNEYDRGAIGSTSSPEIVELLVQAGEELSDVGSKMRSMLTGTEQCEEIEVSLADYQAHRTRTFGNCNPQRMNNSFWEAMVCTRNSAYGAKSKFGESHFEEFPIWCFNRFGQSLTRLPDGRMVEIAGEHEDHYDPDFCIYNDVVVHHGDGTFDIFGYPEADFPTTDFHSATWVAPYVYIIGNLGYPQQRQAGETPVFRLQCVTWKIERVPTTGEKPGWIHRHQARLLEGNRIRISGGELFDDSNNALLDNTQNFILNLTSRRWERETGEVQK